MVELLTTLIIAIVIFIIVFMLIDLVAAAVGGDPRLWICVKILMLLIVLLFVLDRTGVWHYG